ncbi:unnamed protein product [Trichobilharzia regenti]|nr:unnamed protein product [Trichobilharzia regenti]
MTVPVDPLIALGVVDAVDVEVEVVQEAAAEAVEDNKPPQNTSFIQTRLLSYVNNFLSSSFEVGDQFSVLSNLQS